MPWDRPAPEREGLPSAWSLFPEELAALGCPGSAMETFRRLHRPWTWKGGKMLSVNPSTAVPFRNHW